MSKVGVILFTALILTGTASAATPGKDMSSAMRALHYPKAGAVKMGCRAAGSAFRCTATYRHHHVRRFYAQWQADGGFVCAGAKLATCKTLTHGFITIAAAAGDLRGSAQLASRGYMTIHYNDPQPYIAPNCVQSTQPSTWSFCYALDTSNVNVTVHLAHVKTGYVTTVTGATY